MDKERESEVKKKVKHVKKGWKHVLALLLAAALGFSAGVVTCILKPWEKIEPTVHTVDDSVVEDNYLLTISTVEKIVGPASDLITSKFNYKDADTYENYKQFFGKKVPFTTDKVVFTYKGTVSVGIDLSDVDYDIDNKNRIISITIPDVVIKSNEIDEKSFEYPFEANSIFNSTGMSDYTDMLATLKEKKAEQVKSDREFIGAAKQNTKKVLEEFLTLSDETKDYAVIFK